MATTVLPPGPRGHFLTGHLSELKRDWLGALTRYAREYGDFVPLRLGPKPAFLLGHPDLIESVLVAMNRSFNKSPTLRNGRRLFGNGLLMSEDSFWRRQRRLMQPAFHQERIVGYGRTMVAYTQELLDDWPDGAARELQGDFSALTLKIVCRTMFGTDASGLTDQVEAATATISRRFSNRLGGLSLLLPDGLPLPGNFAFLRAADRLDEIIYTIIDQRRRSAGDPRDMISLLLAARTRDGSQMSDRELRDELMTLFLAGHETSALTLTWAVWLLAQHPAVEARLLAELDQVLGGRPAGAEDLAALPYTEAVVRETLRLYPPAWALARETLKPVEIGGYPVPAGAIVIMPQWVVQRDPRWYDQPDEFRPERWLDGLVERLPEFAYFPFGGGGRQCIGIEFARMEAALVLATVVRQFRFELDPSRAVTPWPADTLRPREGVRATVRWRA
jgi:cytochrome P450